MQQKAQGIQRHKAIVSASQQCWAETMSRVLRVGKTPCKRKHN